MDSNPRPCPVCAARSVPLDVVDLNKSCEEARGKFLPLAGVPVYYFICERCGFCHAPELYAWTLEDFSTRIYNDEYVLVDPDYVEVRPHANATHLISLLGDGAKAVRHIDYGGGQGLLSDMLRDSGWDSQSYDPFVDRDVSLASLGKFDFVTAYEVFEHVPDVAQLAANLSMLLKDDGLVLFSTLVTDGNVKRDQRLTWWYASPRNGHISLFSHDSLGRLGGRAGFKFGSFSPNLHAYWRTIPDWAKRFLRVPDTPA